MSPSSDNGSTDSPAGRLRNLFPDVGVYSTGENLGFTGGIITGLSIALQDRSTYILILNPDTVVEPLFLKHLVDAMEAHSEAAAAMTHCMS